MRYLAVFLLALSFGAQANAQTLEPFGYFTTPLTKKEWQPVAKRWSEMPLKLYRDMSEVVRCEDDESTCSPEARELLEIVQIARKLAPRERIEYIHSIFNESILPVADYAQWLEWDHWSPPLETLKSHQGDCEDFVFAKYVALRMSGIKRSDLRIVILDPAYEPTPTELHAVLAVRFDHTWLILDNNEEGLLVDLSISKYAPAMVLEIGSLKQYDLRHPEPPETAEARLN